MEEQVIQQPHGRRKWIWIAAAALLVLVAGGILFTFYVNRFSLVIALQGEPELVLEYGQQYTEPGAEAMVQGSLFLRDGFKPEALSVEIRGDVTSDTLGEYTLTYSAAYYGLSATAERRVQVVDTRAPVITLQGDPDVPLIAGTPYTEEGFTAQDNYDGDITHLVQRQELYGKVCYTVADSSGNSTTVERQIPYYDPIPPTILLDGDAYMQLRVGEDYQEPGFLALDNVDGEVTDSVSVEGTVECFAPGTYPITYTVTDSYENQSVVTRTVEVVQQPRVETVTPTGKVIYLTFDDGPGPYTDELLYLLDYYGVKATFFVTNSGYDEMMKRIVEEGHSIGIHTMTHDYAEIYADPAAFFADLYGMQQIIYENTGVMTTLMRFPGGGSNLVSRRLYPGLMTLLTEAVQEAGFQYFDWNVDSNDAGGAITAKTVAANVIGGVQNQRVSVVLQHDIHGYSVNAVEDIIVWGLENGYTFLPLQSDSPNAHHPVYN